MSKFSTWENCQVIVIIDQGPYDLDTTYVNSLNIWRAEILPGGIVGNERHRVAKFIRDDQGNVTVEWHIARPIGANFDTYHDPTPFDKFDLPGCEVEHAMLPVFRLFCAVIILLSAVPACVDTHRLPKLPSYSDDYYPPLSRRLGLEGRVLVEFHLDQRGQLTAEPTAIQRIWLDGIEQDESAQLGDAAVKLVRTLPSRIDPSSHFKPDPKRTYRVTIVFCPDPPGNCDNRFPPFDNTKAIVVRAMPITSSVE